MVGPMSHSWPVFAIFIISCATINLKFTPESLYILLLFLSEKIMCQVTWLSTLIVNISFLDKILRMKLDTFPR